MTERKNRFSATGVTPASSPDTIVRMNRLEFSPVGGGLVVYGTSQKLKKYAKANLTAGDKDTFLNSFARGYQSLELLVKTENVEAAE